MPTRGHRAPAASPAEAPLLVGGFQKLHLFAEQPVLTFNITVSEKTYQSKNA
jgi:hypothetical protein